jgi:transposase
VLAGVEEGTPVVFEATYGWSWLLDLVEQMGLEPHLAHASGCKAIASSRLKNDRVDARILAHLLRTDLLPEAWIAPPSVRELRAVMRHRAWLVRRRSSLKCRIRAVLADQGLDAEKRLWSSEGERWLSEASLPPVCREVVDDCLAVLDTLAPLIARLEEQIAALAKPDKRVEALMELPGIGRLTAMMLVAEIGDVSRFASARKLCAWAGLIPTVRNSDRKVRHGHITKQGSTWARWALIEAAHVAKRYPPFSRSYAEIAHRRGNHIATVAIARKLLARSFHILKAAS